jgi:hypothetical protein
MDLILGSSNHSLLALKNTKYEQKDKSWQKVGIIKLETLQMFYLKGLI